MVHFTLQESHSLDESHYLPPSYMATKVAILDGADLQRIIFKGD